MILREQVHEQIVVARIVAVGLQRDAARVLAKVVDDDDRVVAPIVAQGEDLGRAGVEHVNFAQEARRVPTTATRIVLSTTLARADERLDGELHLGADEGVILAGGVAGRTAVTDPPDGARATTGCRRQPRASGARRPPAECTPRMTNDGKIALGPVAHFALAVADPECSADWWLSLFDLDVYRRSPQRVLLGNDAVIIALFAGNADPKVLGHLAFRVRDAAALTVARDRLREATVELEDPGNEIGPVAPGSPNLGLWFHDPDGYRWELMAADS